MTVNRSGLRTRDYTRITLASVFSIIADEAINLPVSLPVFDATRFTLLSAMVMMCGFLPYALLACLRFIMLPAKQNRPVYEAARSSG